jgi:hypothetical protein
VGQAAAVDTFFGQNGYMEYALLKKLDIPTPKIFLKEKFPGGMALQTCYLGADHVETLAASVEVTLSHHNRHSLTP